MADVITRFKLETTQYDSKLRDASKGLQAYGKQIETAGKDFTNFSQKAVEAARSLGTIASGATNTKDKLRDLVGAYNDVAKTYNKLTEQQRQTDFGKNMAASLEQLQVRIKETKQELYGLGDATKNAGGGLFGGGKLDGMLQVFGGNVMTKVAGMALGAVTSLTSEIEDAVKQGIELAKQGEGIRIAFERLGRGDILDGLRQATHGTVTDLELMKAAVKFNDFKLPVEELGTMLAFAQQKAKDTGQSVDYMVDSIVTGLGRKSLMILDNLGLSATEVKDKMKETGDMTKAVGAIIREQMAKAGDYVETAADRAAQANVSLQNRMEELGRKFAPVEEASSQLWTSMKIGILDLIDGPLLSLLNYLNQASRSAEDIVTGSLSQLGSNVDDKGNYIKRPAQKGAVGFDWENGTWKPGYSGAVYNAATGQTELPEVSVTGTRREIPKKKPTKGVTKTPKTEEQLNNDEIQKLTQEYIKASDERQASIREEIKVLQDRNAIIQQLKDEATGKAGGRYNISPVDIKSPSGLADLIQDTFTRQQTGLTELKQKVKLELDTEALKTDENTLKTILQTVIQNGIDGMDLQLMGINDQIAKGINIPEETWQNLLDQINEKLAEMNIEPIKINFGTGNIDKEGKKFEKSWQAAASAVQSVGAAMNSIEDPAAKVAGTVMQAVASVALGYAQATTQAASLGPWAWIAFAASGLATMVSTIAAIHSSTGFADGGIVQGNTYSGDQIYAGLNAGEVVLNRAQTAGLAHELEGTGGGGNGGAVQAILSGEQAYIMINRYTKRSGKGELMTWK